MRNFDNIIKKSLKESLRGKVEELEGKLKGDFNEWDQTVTISAQPTDIAEEDIEEGNVFSKMRCKAVCSNKKTFTVGKKTFNLKGLDPNEKQTCGCDGEMDEAILKSVHEEDEKWIQGAIEKPGSLRKKLGVKKDEKIPTEKLKDLKSKLHKKAEGDKKLSKSDSSLSKQVNLALNLKKMKESVQFTEDEVIDLIERLVQEEVEATGLRKTKKVQGASKKENEDYYKSVTKKMKDYLKDGSKGEYSTNPEIFPAGNGELAKMSKKAYVPSDAVQDYIDTFAYGGGMQNLMYDEIKPDEDWMELNIGGSSKTGNSDEYANAVKTPTNKKMVKTQKDNVYGNYKRNTSYKRQPQPIDYSGDKQTKGKLGKTLKTLNQLESVQDDKSKKKLNEEFDRMKNLMGYNQKTQ
jgi:hypothetical protein